MEKGIIEYTGNRPVEGYSAGWDGSESWEFLAVVRIAGTAGTLARYALASCWEVRDEQGEWSEGIDHFIAFGSRQKCLDMLYEE